MSSFYVTFKKCRILGCTALNYGTINTATKLCVAASCAVSILTFLTSETEIIFNYVRFIGVLLHFIRKYTSLPMCILSYTAHRNLWVCYYSLDVKLRHFKPDPVHGDSVSLSFQIRGCIQKFHNEINNNNKHSLRSNTKGYGSKTR